MRSIRCAVATAFFVFITGAVFSESGGGLYGNAAAKVDTSLTIQDMLVYAIQDEYMAQAEYVAIMGKFGAMRPFSNIVNAEASHISWLKGSFAEYKLSAPADEGSSHVILPENLKRAFEIGVQAELDNIAMYDRFLSQPTIKDPKNAGLKAVFERLKSASENHLKAFQNQLGK